MDHHGSDDAGAPVEAALQEAPHGSTTAPFSPAPPPSAPGADPFRPEVLARLPDLDAAGAGRESGAKPARSDGRILSHGLSTKILMGGAALLVLAAVFPFVLGGSGAPKPGTPPAPNAAEAPIWTGQTAETPHVLPGSEGISYEPKMSLSPDLPPAPDFIGASQDANSDPSLQTPPPPAQRPDPSGASGDLGQTPAADRQSQTRAGRPRARANQMMTIGGPAPTSVGVSADDYRRNYQANSRANLADRYPHSAIHYQTVAPGVARLEGIIEKPSVRTTYDAARSSLH